MHSSLLRVTSQPHSHSPGRQQPTRLTTLLTHTLAHDDQVEPRRTRRLFGTSYPSSAPEISPSSSLRSPYSSKTNRTIARRAAVAAHQLSTAVCRPECEGARMVHAFAIELLWLFTRPEGSPALGHRYCARCFQDGYLVRTYHAWPLFLIVSMCFSTVHLTDAGPHSPTVPRLRVHHPHKLRRQHPCYLRRSWPCTNMCVLPSFVSHLSAWLTYHHAFSLLFHHGALNLPRIASSPLPRRHAFVAGIAISTPGYHFPSLSKHPLCLSMTDDGNKLLAEHVKHVHNANNQQ